MSVQILRNDYEKVSHVYKQFPGGEPHVVLNPSNSFTYKADLYTLKAKIRDFNDLGELLAVTDALKRTGITRIALDIPYFPGARQDRPFPNGAFTLSIYAKIINAQGYSEVRVLDPHSLVTPALIMNVEVSKGLGYLVADFAAKSKSSVAGIIAPDAGAVKRAEEVAESTEFKHYFGRVPVLVANKNRDPKTGRIDKYDLPALPEVGRYIVVDDICDGGTTFFLLAQAFHAQSLNLGSWAGVSVRPTLNLWVTHGIFSNDALDKLFKHYDLIGTTDSIFRPSEEEWQEYKHRLSIAEV